MTTRRLLAAAALAAACGAVASPAGADDPERPLLGLTFDHYYDAAALADALATIHQAFPGWTRLEEMGKSREGRPLWVMSVFDPTGRDPAERPAMYIDANTHGNEVQGAEIALYTLKYLLIRRTEPFVASLLKRAVVHVAPCVNPDSRERFLHEPNDENSPRRVLRPVDDDHDGLFDEDGPNDIDGDGEILQMRKSDPDGEWVTDERDDRLMRHRKPGEAGQWRLLGEEGIDDDGDGLVNEDGPGGVDPNRNWPADWRPEPGQEGAGPYPLSEPETRATALWVLAHPRIAAVQSYHNAGMMILRPPAGRTDKEAEFAAEDRAVYDELARRGSVLLPGYRYLQIREGLYKVHGGFVDWTWATLGAFSFTNEVWGVGGGWNTAAQDTQVATLQWNDVALHGKGFTRWHAAKHPTYGDIEIGGWRRFTIRSTPVDFLPDLCLRNCLFTLEHAAAMPELTIASAVRSEGGAKVRVVVKNAAVMPTMSAWARRFKLVPPDTLSVPGAVVLAAALVVEGTAGTALPVKAGRAQVPEGIAGTSSRTFDLWIDPSSPAGTAVYDARLGGVAEGPVR